MHTNQSLANSLTSLSKNRELSLTAFIVLLLVLLLILTPTFLQPANLINIVLNSVIVSILALGEVTVIITKGIDLSVGAAMGLVTLVMGKIAGFGLPVWSLVLLALIFGTLCGAINGAMISFLNLPPIIITLGTLSIYSGAMYIITSGQWVTNVPNLLLKFGSSKIWIFPTPIIVLLLLLLLMTLFLRYSLTGRHIYAVGNNFHAARMVGIPTMRTIFLPYLITGLFAGIAGVLYLSYNGFSTPSTGTDMNLDAIAAAVIGGANVFGGRGSAIGAVLGSLLVGIITEMLVFFHLPAIWNEAAEGIIILIAIIADSSLSARVAKRRG